jgi:hypothetical protein
MGSSRYGVAEVRAGGLSRAGAWLRGLADGVRVQPSRARRATDFQSLRTFSVDYAKAKRAKEPLPDAPPALLERMARWWVCESREAFAALTVECEVLWWEPSVWPDLLWPRGRQIWAAANSLAVLASRYLHSGRKFYVGYDVVSIQAELLGLVDVADTVPKETIEPALDRLEARLAIATEDFQLGAATRAKFDYLLGMGLGLLFVAPASLIVLLNWAAPSRDVVVLDAAASGIAGAFGALVSVLLRLANTGLGLDYRAGATMAVVLGFGRLVLGSIFAVALYWAIIGGLAPVKLPDSDGGRFGLFIAIGFAAGFSERYAQELLSLRQRREDDVPRKSRRVQSSGRSGNP